MKCFLAIDPSGSGVTGMAVIVNGGVADFLEFKNDGWENHLSFILENVRKYSPEAILYETTNYIHKRVKGSLVLLKLIGGIVCLKHVFPPLLVKGVMVSQVKLLKGKLQRGSMIIPGISYSVGRGKGWKYNDQKISLHLLDALIVAYLCGELVK